MNGFDLFKMAVGNLLRRKTRTLLTVLGIVIGTVSIVLMIALGLGMQESVNEQFASQSSVNIIEVSKGDNVNTSSRASESDENDNLQDIDINFFETLEGVEVVSPVITTNIKMASGKYEGSFSVTGIDASMMEALGYELKEGRMLEETDTTSFFFGTDAIDKFKEVASTATSNTSSAGGDTIDDLRARMREMGGGGFGGGAPGGAAPEEGDEEEEDYNVDIYSDRITMSLDTQYSPQGGKTSIDADIYRVKGIGILEDGDRTRDQQVYVELDALIDMIEDYDDATDGSTDSGYNSAYVMVTDMDDVDAVEALIENYGYSTSTSSSFLETMQGTTETLTIALGAIGAVSLLVAAIGITNTMIMAINERKKEIGVMKVIGATIKDIKYLFLTEAAMIGFLGGIFGVGVSYLASIILSSGTFSSVATGNARNPMATLTSFNIVMPTWLIVVGMVFTTLVGIISGYLPAKQAMRSSALEAIRTE